MMKTNRALMLVAGLSVAMLTTACAHTPPLDPYTPACYKKLVRVWDKTQNKWVKREKTLCTIGNIY